MNTLAAIISRIGRKNLTAIVTAASAVAVLYGLPKEKADAIAGLITAIGAAVILGIAHEDNGRNSNPSNKPPGE